MRQAPCCPLHHAAHSPLPRGGGTSSVEFEGGRGSAAQWFGPARGLDERWHAAVARSLPEAAPVDQLIKLCAQNEQAFPGKLVGWIGARSCQFARDAKPEVPFV